MFERFLITISIGLLFMMPSGATAQTAREVRGAASVEPVSNEPPAKIVVDAPLAEALSHGRVVIQYRTENLHIAPVFGPALDQGIVNPTVPEPRVAAPAAPAHFQLPTNERLAKIVIDSPQGRGFVAWRRANWHWAEFPAGPHNILIQPVNRSRNGPSHRAGGAA